MVFDVNFTLLLIVSWYFSIKADIKRKNRIKAQAQLNAAIEYLKIDRCSMASVQSRGYLLLEDRHAIHILRSKLEEIK